MAGGVVKRRELEGLGDCASIIISPPIVIPQNVFFVILFNDFCQCQCLDISIFIPIFMGGRRWGLNTVK